MRCQIRPFVLPNGDTDESRWYIKLLDTQDRRYVACAGTENNPVLFMDTYPYYFSSKATAVDAARKNALYVEDD